MKSKLPQHRKSDEEIARLRESLGVSGEQGKPGSPPPQQQPPPPMPFRQKENPRPPSPSPENAEPLPLRAGKEKIAPAQPAPPASPDQPDEPEPARRFADVSLKSTASADAAPGLSVTKLPAPLPPPEQLPLPAGMERRGKPVRSLRRSERMPSPARPERSTEKRTDSPLPAHRHDDGELQSLRARNAMMVKPPVEQIKSLAAHPALVVLGYLLAFAGGIGGLIVALWFFLKKPRSQYHAAFITIISLLVLVFGTLYFFSHQPDAP